MSALGILFLALQCSVVSGRLTTLRGKESKYNSSPDNRKLLCVSEDDGGGLIWNSNLNWLYSSYQFSDRKEITGQIDCDLNPYEKCTRLWSTVGWNITNSTETPMGPVFDRRWEGFVEYNNFNTPTEYRFMGKVRKSGAFAVSIRGSRDAHILLCETESYKTHLCYWMIIGGWENTKSAIRKCANGVPNSPMYLTSDPTCAPLRVSYIHQPLSRTEWRTFIVTWNENMRKILLYDTEKLILTFEDTDKQSNSNVNYNLFISSNAIIQFRFHTYNFIHTNNPEATLTSPAFFLSATSLCIEMIIGLCVECKMELALINSLTKNKEESLAIISGSTVTAAHGLAMWQYIRINRTISSNYETYVEVKMIPMLDRTSANPLWAVANFRECPPIGSVRIGSIVASQDYNNGFFWPDVTCQKLFYNESIVVNAALNAVRNVTFDDLDCPDGMVGPYCSISCQNHLGNDETCQNTVICEKAGCTCPPGFINGYCNKRCSSNQYGHDCKYTCGSCRQHGCNFRNGDCENGCDNDSGYKVPPLCQIGINGPPPPTIDFINETTVRVVLPMKDEYKLVRCVYEFSIQKEGERKINYIRDNEVSVNSTVITGYTDRLQPGVSYQIWCNLHVNDYGKIDGKWTNFTTKCTPFDFEVEQRNTSLILKKSPQTDAPYPCPAEWYDLDFENGETHAKITKGILSHLPHEFVGLEPYTPYNITISKGSKTYFSQAIRTLEAAPTAVRKIQLDWISNKEVTIIWGRPGRANGIIKKYEITMQIAEYYGCNVLGRNFPKKNRTLFSEVTSIRYPDLTPYATYIVFISACTSYCGPVQKYTFQTPESEIPTETFSNLRQQNYWLTWDPPNDCTTISGPLYSRIIINGISESVMNLSVTKQTWNQRIDCEPFLSGAETYEAQVYVIRGYNKSHNELLSQRITFTTPPKAPPPVEELEIYEHDTRNNIIYLRWKKPKVPTNGKIGHYIVKNKRRTLLIVLPTEYCDLWDRGGYLCAKIEYFRSTIRQISVSAVNVNVSTPGDAVDLSVTVDKNPLMPEIFHVEALAKGVVNVTWSHPWRTGRGLETFLINIQMISSNLRTQSTASQYNIYAQYFVEKYQVWYNYQLYLLPSSTYKITIFAKTIDQTYSGEKSTIVETPLAMEFESEPTFEVSAADSTVLLHIPVVLNDTKNSITYVAVEGPHPCNNHAKLNTFLSAKAGIKDHDMSWRAAMFSTDKFAGKTFVVGDNKIYDGSINCPLKSQESYVVAVILQTEEESMNSQFSAVKTMSIQIGEVPKRHDEAWLVPTAVILVVSVAGFYYYRRRKREPLKNVILQENMALPQTTENRDDIASLNSNRILCTTPIPPKKECLLSASTSVQNFPVPANEFDGKEERTSLVHVKDFEDYVKHANDSGLLEKQYNILPRGQTKPWDYGKLPQNKPKNRYGNLIAYDENRVILEKLPQEPHSDYINANYIDGYKKEKCYIATQGPKPNTVNDFWRMIWQEETLIICMLANVVETGKTKCEQYWPDIGKKKKYGDLLVFNAKHTVFADYTFRVLHVTRDEETRKVEHLHYTAWPDHGVPFSTHSVVTYLKKLLATSPGNGPVVVHCSAGVGRTGTIILCDICLRRAAAEKVVDVFAETESIRSQRANMVDTKQQYVLAHLTLVECLLSISTSLPCDETLPSRITELKKQLTIQQQSLEKGTWQDEALRPSTIQVSLSERNLAKHRFPELASVKVNRVYLKRYPPTDEYSDYICAVPVDGVRLQNQYFATQLPLPGTLGDFWRLVAEYKVELIVMLQPPDPEDTTCCPIVPKPVAEQQVTILSCTEWKAGRKQNPPTTIALVTLWQATERIARGDEPTVVLCHDGVTACGLYLALCFLLERMAVERECDVCLSIRAVRRSREDFVESLEQLEYLYDAAITYLKYFETYANFT
ncbi:Receptor-type tyrosine-protein phosphatase T [Dufourea novaeangliae]|uniref:protein-tyrosine-phosphatase n=1 Tax=Dufourea novaeangliae TaxID=178035 RepID=A0A154P5A5_DUFNO|nr:Receptor-type tyrosine-protein phosphatase T [Dufourea novaeangliae]